VHYDGEVFSVADFPPIEADVPIYHAALGPANRRVVGRLCDGWLPHNVPFPDLDDAFEGIATAARERGRDPEAITVAPYVPAAASEDPDEAERAVRGHVAYYVGSAAGYRNAVGSRFPEASEAIASAWNQGDREAAAEAVTEEMVAALGVCGTPAEARAQLEALYEETIVDYPLVIVPQQAADDLAAGTLEALAPLATEG
jgi:alkanesulfonate monooxygenase SsuD/methylene tetrahydromethanopterin reductase-like flavin-dependent oxidoreductase (luciferase family)